MICTLLKCNIEREKKRYVWVFDSEIQFDNEPSSCFRPVYSDCNLKMSIDFMIFTISLNNISEHCKHNALLSTKMNIE